LKKIKKISKFLIDFIKFRKKPLKIKDNLFLGQEVKNFFLFQKYLKIFKWPAWISLSLNFGSKEFTQITPNKLENNILREGMFFSNFLSSDSLLVDSACMISPTYAKFSVELWVSLDDKIYRPQENLDNVTNRRNYEEFSIAQEWSEKKFTLLQSGYGTKGEGNEALISIDIKLKEIVKKSYCIIVLRPYNNEILGTVKKIKYYKDDRMLSVDGKKIINFLARPSAIITGDEFGDIDLDFQNASSEVASYNNFASIAVAYKLKKGDNNFVYRISLDGELIEKRKVDFVLEKDAFLNYTSLLMHKGTDFISLSFEEIKKVFFSSKMVLLNNTFKKNFFKDNSRDFYFYIDGLLKMGYNQQAFKIIDNNFAKVDPKSIKNESPIDLIFLFLSLSDYYLYSKDSEFLRSRYHKLSQISLYMLKLSSKIKKNNKYKFFKIPYDEDPFEKNFNEIILFSFFFKQLSYLARSMGIFGEENKFKKEHLRLSKLLKKGFESENYANNLFSYYLFSANYPFKLGLVENEVYDFIDKSYNESFPVVYNPSIGIDIVNSLIMANNLLLMGDSRAIQVIEKLNILAGEKKSFPQFMNPKNNRGSFGDFESVAASSLYFSLIRNLFFIDYEESLEIFPLVMEDFFIENRKSSLINAPSRYGNISLSFSSTLNEFNLFFQSLPKFVPPEIKINFPKNFKIVEGDDFIIKIEEANYVTINGWPSEIKFKRN